MTVVIVEGLLVIVEGLLVIVEGLLVIVEGSTVVAVTEGLFIEVKHVPTFPTMSTTTSSTS